MGLLEFIENMDDFEQFMTIIYGLACVIYIPYKLWFEDNAPEPDSKDEKERIQIIPIFPRESRGEKVLSGLFSSAVAIIIWIFGYKAMKGKGEKKEDVKFGIFVFILVQIILIISVYIPGYSKVSEFWTKGEVEWENNNKWGTPSDWWLGMFIAFLANIALALLFTFLYTENYGKIDVLGIGENSIYMVGGGLMVLAAIMWLIVGQGSDGVFKPTDKDSAQLDDVAQTVFSLSSLGFIGILVSKSVGDDPDKEKLKWIIPVIAGYWFVNLLIFKMRNRPKDLDETAEKSPAHPVMMADNWFDNENVKFNLYEDVEEGIQYENYWLPMSNSFLNLSGISYLIFYIALVLVPTFIMKKTEYRSGWLVFSSLIIPLCVLISNKAIAAGTREEEYTHLSSLDLYTNFVRGTHKDWDMDAYNFVDVVRLIVRLFIFVVIYGGPIYWVYNTWSRPLNFAAILAWVIIFPIILSKLIAHDCILSGDKKLLELRKDNDDENFSDKQWELAFHQHGGLVTMVTLCVIGLLIINFK